MWMYINNEIVKAEDAKIHVSDLAIQRGYGIFDFFRTKQHVLLYVEHHLNRFLHSASEMNLSVTQSKEELFLMLQELMRKNQLDESGFKMIVTGGYSPDGYTLAKPNLIIQQNPLKLSPPQLLNVITYEYQREFATIKTINYIAGIRQQKQLLEAKADDVLYCFQNQVTEFPRSNFFIVTQDDEVVTPDKNVLKGVTRTLLLDMAAKKWKTTERRVTMEDVYQAKEAFLTGSSKRIQPIATVNGKIIGDGRMGKITESLFALLQEYEEKYIQIHG